MSNVPPSILIVDDNVENLRVAVDLLESHGHAVRTAGDGPMCLRRARMPGVRLILLDVQMPGLDGYEVCRQLKADPQLAAIPVIFMTARTDVEDKVQAFEAGGVDFITKPFEARELLARAETHLQLGLLRDELARRNQELEELNASLQDRVDAQVGTLVARAEEVERLNRQLRAQVQDRSEALARALQKLSDRDEQPDLEGRLLGDRYLIGPLIGRGGMGSVHEGLDRATDERIAIKVMRTAEASPEWIERFLQEARAAASIDHPAIVRMRHVDVDEDGLLYQIQELVTGETLAACLNRRTAFAHGPAARVLAALAGALAAAHVEGVVHRDLKPANVMLTRTSPGLKLLDFGLAKLFLTRSGAGDTGLVLGTPRFMSPEQLAGASDVGPPTDIYALGVLAHLMWTGTFPEGGPSVSTADVTRLRRSKSLTEEPTLSERAAPPGVRGAPASTVHRDAVLALIGRCLAAHPRERPDAQDVAVHMHTLADAEGAGPLLDVVADVFLASPLTAR